MKSLLTLAAFLFFCHLFGQTMREDTVFFEEILPTELDNFGCHEDVSFQVPEGAVSAFFKVVNIRMIVEGETFGSVYPDDLELRLQCLTNTLTVDRQVDGPSAAGLFQEFEDNVDIANDVYSVFDIIQFRIYAKRTYQDSPANPSCGTEEARINKWLIIIEYFADDLDMDGYKNDEDCDDTDPSIHPGATEGCNGQDDNCNGKVDEGDVCTNIFVGLTDDWFYWRNWSLLVPPTGRHQVVIPAGKHAAIRIGDLTTSVLVGSVVVKPNGQVTLVGSLNFFYRQYFEVEEGGLLDLSRVTITRELPR